MGDEGKLATRTAPNAVTTFAPTTLAEAMQFAKLLADSDLVPKDYRGKPGNVLVAIQMGAELGVPPTQAVQGIAVVNGRPAVYGDLLLAIVQRAPSYEYHNESFDEATMTATCIMKRKNAPEATVTSFSKADAEKAKLWGKEGPWSQYPKRMLQLRARAFCARDTFADALRGVAVAEEVADYVIDVERVETRTAPAMPRELPAPAPAPAPVEPTPAPAEVQGPTIPDGFVKLVSVKTGRSGERKDGSRYQAYEIEWAGGKEETFSRPVYERAQEAIAQDRWVKLNILKRPTGQTHVAEIEVL